ncbi:MAG TPA: ABC transporter ATP-binding protein [Candidatus Binatia bacterium]|jgi:ABC-type lipoprotein export system ATPase subunit
MSAVGVAALHKRYPSKAGWVEALHDVSFSLPAGTLGCVVGPSGSGKSTLLGLVGGLDTPTAGAITVGTFGLHRMTAAERGRFRTARVGFIFQSNNLIPVLTASENVALPLSLGTLTKGERARRVAVLIDELGLGLLADRRPGELSGGQQQRVGIARALVTQPMLVLADEPTAHLDAQTGRDVMDVLRAASRKHATTFLVATHDADVEARADVRVTLRDGSCVAAAA